MFYNILKIVLIGLVMLYFIIFWRPGRNKGDGKKDEL